MLAYAWVCIFSKRFHDAGQSGWMTIAAIVAIIVVSMVVSVILTPVFGGVDVTNMASLQAMSTGLMVKNMITSVIANGVVGFYMFKLKPAAV